jgi:VanZ family protein
MEITSNRRGLGFWLSAWIPVALGIAVIAAESTEAFGADHMSGPLRWLFQAIFGQVSDSRWLVLHGLIRKSGHFVGYGAIGLAWLRAWRLTLVNSWWSLDAALALLCTALLASADEFHQALLPNRTGSPWDVLLDCCGAMALQLGAYSLICLIRSVRQADPA